jgi:hypothetical protein
MQADAPQLPEAVERRGGIQQIEARFASPSSSPENFDFPCSANWRVALFRHD